MDRRRLLLGLLLTGSACAGARGARAAAPTPAELAASRRYLAALRNPEGGYRPAAAPGPAQLSATVAGLRGLRYLGGTVVGLPAARTFALSCRAGGGPAFAETPGGEPGPRATCMGLMVLAEAGAARDPAAAAAARYLAEQARTPSEVYLAAAALDAARLTRLAPAAWKELFRAARRPDGTYGADAAETATAVITLLRLGETLPESPAAHAQLRGMQRPDGGWAPPGEASDLATTYRILRACRMLQLQPDLERLRAFVAACRNQDGGYGARPGQPSGAGPTYQAAIVLHWAQELAAPA